MILSVCHDCIVDYEKEYILSENRIGFEYQGTSPDEIALVEASAIIGF